MTGYVEAKQFLFVLQGFCLRERLAVLRLNRLRIPVQSFRPRITQDVHEGVLAGEPIPLAGGRMAHGLIEAMEDGSPQFFGEIKGPGLGQAFDAPPIDSL